MTFTDNNDVCQVLVAGQKTVSPERTKRTTLFFVFCCLLSVHIVEPNVIINCTFMFCIPMLYP